MKLTDAALIMICIAIISIAAGLNWWESGFKILPSKHQKHGAKFGFCLLVVAIPLLMAWKVKTT